MGEGSLLQSGQHFFSYHLFVISPVFLFLEKMRSILITLISVEQPLGSGLYWDCDQNLSPTSTACRSRAGKSWSLRGFGPTSDIGGEQIGVVALSQNMMTVQAIGRPSLSRATGMPRHTSG